LQTDKSGLTLVLLQAGKSGLTLVVGVFCDAWRSDRSCNALSRIGPSGKVTVLLGTADAGIHLNDPQGIAVDHAGTVYVADAGNESIVKITKDGVASRLVGSVAAELVPPSDDAAAYSGQPFIESIQRAPQPAPRRTVLGKLPASVEEPTELALDEAGVARQTEIIGQKNAHPNRFGRANRLVRRGRRGIAPCLLSGSYSTEPLRDKSLQLFQK
jgi:hypothetical protein